MTSSFALTHVNLIDDGKKTPDAMLIVERGVVVYAGPAAGAPPVQGIPVIDGHGLTASPGLIDIQFNGGYGHDFTQDPHTILEVAQRLPKTGVVAFQPTFITSPIEAYAGMLEATASARHAQATGQAGGARIIGAHVEGPFLSPAKKGAHREEWFCDPTQEALAQLRPIEAVSLLTLAPERNGGVEAIRWLRKQGVVVSIGHSAAGMREAQAAIEAGATCATHLYNAMTGMAHRDPGLVGSLLAMDGVFCGLIVDGIHVHPQMVKVAYRCLGPGRVVLVTDAMAAMGMPPGDYVIGAQKVIVDGVSARLEDGTLAGSILSLDEAVRNMIAFTGCSPEEALQMATATPALALGRAGQMGHLRPGYPADLTLLDDRLRVQATVINGYPAYIRPGVDISFS